MVSKNRAFIPELWSQQVVDSFKLDLNKLFIKRRSKGERLLRAAARGASQEEIDKIDADEDTVTQGELYDYVQKRYTDDAADALALAMDAHILGNLSTRS